MLFVIYAKDQAEDTNALRNEHYAAHKEHLEKCGDYGVEIVTAGPLVSDDARRALGSLIICQAEARQDVITFNREDPFYKVGVWQNVDVTAFDKRRG